LVKKVGIVGIGYYGFRSVTPELSFREMIYEAAAKAYQNAGLQPKDIDGFVNAGEDWSEGHSIADEITPDQLGAVKRPVFTVNADFMHALISAVMHILTDQMNICLVASYSKASNVKDMAQITTMAMDPVFSRPLGETSYFVAGLEMNRYLHETGTTRAQCAQVVVKNKGNALLNPYAGHGISLKKEEVLESEMVSYPLTRLDMSPHSDGAVVMIVAAEERARAICKNPIWIEGMGWCSDSPSLERRPWGEAVSTQIAAEMAYRMAGINYPRKEIDLVEVSDEFSYKELQHLEALRLCKKGEAGFLVEEGALGIAGDLPVNPSGGCLGVGSLLEATGAQKVLELVLQLRGEGGQRQVPNAEVGLAQTWRGIPTTSGAVLILSNR
jgi:acetyl-CoA C-acetyltransferase